jgi:hypothetical protein
MYTTIILHSVLNRCENSFLHYGKNRTKVFENTVLSSIFGPKSKEAIVGYGKMHHVELHHLHSLTSTIFYYKIKNEMDETCRQHRTEYNACWFFLGKLNCLEDLVVHWQIT